MTAEELSPDLLRLMEHEKPLEDATAAPSDIAWALARIRDDVPYRAAGYPDFDAYLAGRWGA